MSVGKKCWQTLFSAQNVNNRFTRGAVVTCRWDLTVSGVGDVMGQSKKLNKLRTEWWIERHMEL